MMKQPPLHKYTCMSVEHINTGRLIPVILSQCSHVCRSSVHNHSKGRFFQCCCIYSSKGEEYFLHPRQLFLTYPEDMQRFYIVTIFFLRQALIYYWRRKWQPSPALLPGESHQQGSLMGYSPWGRKTVKHDWAPHTFTLVYYKIWLSWFFTSTI